MTNRHKRFWLITCTLALACHSAAANLVSLDSAFGPGTITLDQSTGLRWLDLTLTTPYTFNQAVAQTGVGGLFEGFHIASGDEVFQLWKDAGIDVGFVGVFTTQNFVPVTNLMTLVGGPLSHEGNLGGGNFFDYTVGYVTDVHTPDWYTLASLSADPDPTLTGRASFGEIPISQEVVGQQGSWLVTSVPEPSSLLLLGSGLFTAACRLRKRARQTMDRA